ncbi:MAG: DNA methyltransferase, partial [Nitrososphaeraceae archaeon]|nr:DNA methyltransferase [Nitrososphaeraceae archaeon]
MRQITEIANNKKNQVLERDLPVHRWYQFVLGYPPHLVRYYLNAFNISRYQIVLDPFCGTGTTNVECLKNGINNVGIEANPIAYFASKVKTNLKLEIDQLRNYFGYICKSLIKSFEYLHIRDNYSPIFIPLTNLDPITIKSIPQIDKEKQKVIPIGFISETPLKKVLIIKEIIYSIPVEAFKHFFMLSLANLIVNKAGNIAFGPEIYRTKPKHDIDLINYFTAITENMIRDIERFQS